MLVQCYLYAVAASALPRFLNSHCSLGLVAIFAIITIIMATIVTLFIITTIILVSLVTVTRADFDFDFECLEIYKKKVDFDFDCAFLEYIRNRWTFIWILNVWKCLRKGWMVDFWQFCHYIKWKKLSKVHHPSDISETGGLLKIL